MPGPRRTVSKLRNETYHVFSNLHPGTTYLFSVRARTGKGFGQTALTEITTNISGRFCRAPRSVLLLMTAVPEPPVRSCGFWGLAAAMEGCSWWWQPCRESPGQPPNCGSGWGARPTRRTGAV